MSVDVIHPATAKHIAKAEDQASVMVAESPAVYLGATLPYMDSLPSGSIQWVYNVLDKTVCPAISPCSRVNRRRGSTSGAANGAAPGAAAQVGDGFGLIRVRVAVVAVVQGVTVHTATATDAGARRRKWSGCCSRTRTSRRASCCTQI